MKKEPEEIADAPVVVGTHGNAWLYHGSEAGASLGAWLVRAPWAHPLWNDYCLACCHLREMPGMPEAIVHLEGATHEICLWAVDPGQPTTLEKIRRLEPANFVGQFIADDDEAALRRVMESVQEICNGLLSPDTDFLRQWIERYGDHALKKQ